MCSDTASCPRRRFAHESPDDTDYFQLMCRRLAEEGGFIPETLLRERWMRRGRSPHEMNAWLADGRLRSIRQGPQRWLPSFQFQIDDGCTPRADVAIVAAELVGGMDDAEILAWFVCGNASLDGETPIRRLHRDLPAVLQAARMDRFIGSA